MTSYELVMLQVLPLDVKIMKSKQRIEEWYRHWNGQVYISFSGGKDSTVLLHLVRSMYPDVVAVYSDTGLEYPEIRQFVNTINNVITIRPKMQFKDVIKIHGYPIISKEIAGTIGYARKGSIWAKYRLDGKHSYGNHKKYKYLLQSDFKISDKCCNELKKKPFKEFEKNTGLKPFIGTMASEGGQRESAYKKNGCNAFEGKRPISTPIGFWEEKDIWEYIKLYNLEYSKIYDMGYNRTGCMFCCFGVHLEKGENRFQKMSKTHPKQYEYCMKDINNGGLGLSKVLGFISVDTTTKEE